MLSNSAYSEQEASVREEVFDSINAEFKAMLRDIVDPGYEQRKEEEMKAIPLYAVGMRIFENMKLQMEDGVDPSTN